MVLQNRSKGVPIAGEWEDQIVLGFDLWASLGAIVTGWTGELPGQGDSSDRPTADYLEGDLLRRLEPQYGPYQAAWPGRAPFALGLSHDVDRIRKTFQHLTHPLRELRRGRLAQAAAMSVHLDPGAYWCFDRIEAIESRWRVRSTFFFLHDAPGTTSPGLRERILLTGATRLDRPDVINAVKQLREGGWDIGLHSSAYTRSDPERLRREKALLEAITRRPVEGVRQHFLAPVVANLWKDQEYVGFRYDSTMGFADRVGFKAGTCFPYPVGESAPFYEIPFQIMDGSLTMQNDAWARCSRIIDSVAQVGGALVLLWHQRFFNDFEFPGFSPLYERIVEECVRRGAWIAPLNEIAGWWRGGFSEN